MTAQGRRFPWHGRAMCAIQSFTWAWVKIKPPGDRRFELPGFAILGLPCFDSHSHMSGMAKGPRAMALSRDLLRRSQAAAPHGQGPRIAHVFFFLVFAKPVRIKRIAQGVSVLFSFCYFFFFLHVEKRCPRVGTRSSKCDCPLLFGLEVSQGSTAAAFLFFGASPSPIR